MNPGAQAESQSDNPRTDTAATHKRFMAFSLHIYPERRQSGANIPEQATG
jgi:hypothetical protein